MYYLIYKTTNLVNGKIYIGAHQTTNINDGYLGSGKWLKRAVKKYGVDSFSKEILFVFDNAFDMYTKEAELVTDEFISESNTYNIRVGGKGGFDHIDRSSASHILVMRNNRINTNQKLQERYGNNWQSVLSNLHKAARLKAAAQWVLDNPDKVKQNMSNCSKKALSDKSKSKRKKTFSEIGHQQGEKNSQYGKMWIYNTITWESKSIYKQAEIPEGWKKGRKLKQRNVR